VCAGRHLGSHQHLPADTKQLRETTAHSGICVET
jgi:hypothetical protein